MNSVTVTGMNDTGSAVGYATDLTAHSRPLRWDIYTGVVTDIGSSSRLFQSYDVNDAGVIVGQTYRDRPAVWTPGAGPAVVIENDRGGYAMAIADDGVVAGYLLGDAENPEQTFRWTPGRPVHLESEEWSHAWAVGPDGATLGDHNGKAALFYPDETE